MCSLNRLWPHSTLQNCLNFVRPEDKIKKLERRITELIDESCLAASRQQLRQALDKAKEASSKERSLIRLQEQAGLSDTHNLDLTFSVSPIMTSLCQ